MVGTIKRFEKEPSTFSRRGGSQVNYADFFSILKGKVITIL
jgi:hypothetical protein